MEEKNEIVEDKLENKKSNIIINIIIIIVIFLVSLLMYAKYVGTSGLIVKEYRIKSNKIPTNFNGAKIIFISDILYGSTVYKEEIDLLLTKVNELKPDIVIFGGGLVSEDYSLSKKEKTILIDFFKGINANLGKYAVKGYTDYDYENIINEGGFITLENSFDYIYKDETNPICLIGVGSFNASKYDIEAAFNGIENANCYKIVISHESDIVKNIMPSENKPDLILVGNSLGGEINIPFIGPLYNNIGSEEYYLEYYKKGDTKIYVSSGLGTNKYHMRLFNKPSFNFFRLKNMN